LALHRKGLTAREIIRKGLAHPSTVYSALAQFKPAVSNAVKVWTAEEYALQANMTDAEVAARTSSKARAVAERRRTLRPRKP
jgi:hypothetical protein